MLGYERETFRRDDRRSRRRRRPSSTRTASRSRSRSSRTATGRPTSTSSTARSAPAATTPAEVRPAPRRGRPTCEREPRARGSTTRRALECDWEPLKATYRRSLVDLAALRFSPPIAGGHEPAGRGPAVVHDDVRPRQHLHEPAGAAVHARARRDDAARARRLAGQPRRRLPRRGPGPDPARDALRRDDRVRGAAALAVLRLAPTRRRSTSCCSTSTSAGPATGSSSATSSTRRAPRSTGSTSTPTCMGNGYIWYQRRNEETGLENQCWKDSWDSISFRDGRLPGFPRATCELQGYAYDAKVRGARLARLDLEGPGAAPTQLEQRGGRPQAALQPRLLGRGRRVLRARARRRRAARSTRSPRTTATCSGAASSTSRRPRPSSRHLMGPRLFSGWGVRTLAEGEGALQPDRLPRRHGLAVRQLVHRLGPAPLRLQGRGGADRRRHPRRRRVLRRPAARGVRRLRRAS